LKELENLFWPSCQRRQYKRELNILFHWLKKIEAPYGISEVLLLPSTVQGSSMQKSLSCRRVGAQNAFDYDSIVGFYLRTL